MIRMRVAVEPQQTDLFRETPAPTLSDEDLERMLTEPTSPEPVGKSLEVAWEYAQQTMLTKPSDPWVIADKQTGKLYDLSVEEASNTVALTPVKLTYTRMPDNTVKIPAGSDGNIDWATVYTTYFPGGFNELYDPKVLTQDKVVSATVTMPDFWRKVLAKLFEGYMYNKLHKNPYKK